MKVLLVNKFFYQRGGDTAVFFSTADLLKKNRHSVSFFSMHDEKNLKSGFSGYFVSGTDLNAGQGLFQTLMTAGRIHYSFESKSRIRRLIRDQRPDIAHLHNICHQISPSIIHALKAEGIPVVMTLHDYKLTCPVYTLMRDGRPCNDCAGGRFYKAVVNRCTKGSAIKSAINASEMYLHHSLLHIYEKVDEFISPSMFLLHKTAEMGFKGSLNYLPNFIQPEDFEPSYGSDSGYIVYVGRLSAEKGVSTLIDAMKGLGSITLKVIGDGPLRQDLVSKVNREGIDNVDFLGFKNGEELKNLIGSSAFAVIPSEWYENNPRSVLEVFAMGKPVIGASIGGIPEIVKDGVTGFTFRPGDPKDLREKITKLASDPTLIEKYGRSARMTAEKEYGPETHYAGLMKIYETAMRKNNKRIL